jgi:hypothetical protein
MTEFFHSKIWIYLKNIISANTIYIYICIFIYIYIYIYIYINKSYKFKRIFLFIYEFGYISPSTKLHCFSSQLPSGITHSSVQTALINNVKDQCIFRLHSQRPCHCKWQFSERVSQTFCQSYDSHYISGFIPNWGIMDYVVSNTP